MLCFTISIKNGSMPSIHLTHIPIRIRCFDVMKTSQIFLTHSFLGTCHPFLHTFINNMSRLRFNRAKLNQSLFKRHRALSQFCPTCEDDVVETVEHVVMHCPRYDVSRFNCFCELHHITGFPPLLSSFPFPFLLGVFPRTVSVTVHQRLLNCISMFLNKVQRMRQC